MRLELQSCLVPPDHQTVDCHKGSLPHICSRVSGNEIGWGKSARAIFFASWLNALLIFIPFAWLSHFKDWSHSLTFALCFLSIVGLEKLLDWGGEHLRRFIKDRDDELGDLIAFTLNNIVEATLAIVLLCRCELKLLQSTIVGVVLLHLLLIPGSNFLIHGRGLREQRLHPDRTELNKTLLIVGILALTIPAAFFASIGTDNANGGEGVTGPSDTLRRDMLQISRGFAVILLAIYICSRIYLYLPSTSRKGIEVLIDCEDCSGNEIQVQLQNASIIIRKEDSRDEPKKDEPKANHWACLLLLAVTVALMGVTVEFLVESIEFVRHEVNIKDEWFGIVLLPLMSFSADGALAIMVFFRKSGPAPNSFAKGRAIDMSIQFLLFWTPLVTLLGWWLDKPMSLLFDLFEVMLIVGAGFLVNSVTGDGKTNWAEGFILMSFYMMIVLSPWHYPGQSGVRFMDACESVASAVASSVGQGQ